MRMFLWLDPNKVREVTVIGSKKMAIYNDSARGATAHLRPRRRVGRAAGGALPAAAVLAATATSSRRTFQFEEPLSLEVRHFLGCIRDECHPADGWP